MNKLYKPGSLKELRELVNNETALPRRHRYISNNGYELAVLRFKTYRLRRTGNVEHIARHYDGANVPQGEIFQPPHRKLGRFVRNEHGMHLLRLQQFQSAIRRLGRFIRNKYGVDVRLLQQL